jgi:hypothetical protein
VITKLTPEQEAKFPEYRERWIANGLSTEPADFDRAETAVRAMYRVIGRDEPLIVLRMGSPFGAVLGGYVAHALLDGVVRQQVEQQIGQQIGQQTEQHVQQHLQQQIEQQIEQHVQQQVGRQARQHVWQQVGQHVEQHVWQHLQQQIEQHVWLSEVREKYGLSVYDYRGANLWAGWGAYASFFIENGLIDTTTPAVSNFLLDKAIMESCGLVWFSTACAAISDRPLRINRDDAGQLHCENGPAMLYRDGWAIYAWHGVVIPGEWVENRETIDVEEILKETEADKRTAGLQCYGMARLKDRFGKLVHDSGCQTTGALWSMKLPGLRTKAYYLLAMCPRNGEIFEAVMPTSNIDGLPIRTAQAAQAWRRRLPACDFEPSPYRT